MQFYLKTQYNRQGTPSALFGIIDSVQCFMFIFSLIISDHHAGMCIVVKLYIKGLVEHRNGSSSLEE